MTPSNWEHAKVRYPDLQRRHRKRNKARSRALVRLAHRFPGVFGRYYREELEKEGL